MGDVSDQVAPNPVFSRDLAVLIGVLAVLEGSLMGNGDVPGHLAERLRHRFAREGLLDPDASEEAFRQAINDLNHRLRYGLGEYPELPPPIPVPELP
ncbi:hypothetical protein F8271_30815 [Micromonospora sp. ALFpr18c]|uniref:hypothetical protein n=1 Tax=unclassified Micromonospora TaxID=2617518 RepID=UPI00124AE825|nr:hypothetical protein [Micromonospora sp. ALFpr18c]KAB1923825.1 hypothetical protein F8271_30815 [Micromonospora sp. ALFpr18c]